jgi:hypothetical protein
MFANVRSDELDSGQPTVREGCTEPKFTRDIEHIEGAVGQQFLQCPLWVEAEFSYYVAAVLHGFRSNSTVWKSTPVVDASPWQ